MTAPALPPLSLPWEGTFCPLQAISCVSGLTTFSSSWGHSGANAQGEKYPLRLENPSLPAPWQDSSEGLLHVVSWWIPSRTEPQWPTTHPLTPPFGLSSLPVPHVLLEPPPNGPLTPKSQGPPLGDPKL